jgi:hypothetical protein
VQFHLTFNFTIEYPTQKEVLHQIKDFIFHRQPKEATPMVVYSYHQSVEELKEAVHCWKIDVDNIDDDDLHDIHIKESEGECALKGKAVEMVAPYYNGLKKTKKHIIDTKEAPKMAIIGDYWDNEMVTQVVYLLKEYEDLFPQRFSKMKGISRSLGAMKIQLQPNSKPVKRRPYWLNPMYKEKVHKKLDQMLDARIIIM